MAAPLDDGDIIEAIQGKLRRYPHVRYEASPSHILIFPLDDTGFRVEVLVFLWSYLVRCEGWYSQFARAEDALECVEHALGVTTRLEVWLRGRTAYRWILQRRRKQGWSTVSDRRSLLVPFWRRRRIVHL